jgi:hypothetical protein
MPTMSREEIPGDLVKLCPQCGSQYQIWVERCLDCDTPLVHGAEGHGADNAVPEEVSHDVRAYPQDCVLVRTAPASWIDRLSKDLDEAGIRHWVSVPAWRRDTSRLYVLLSDLAAASAIDLERYAMEMPEMWTEQEDARPRPAPRREASSYDPESKVCPSCGGEYQLWAERCADCGIPLVRPRDLDPARDSEPRAAAPAPAQAKDHHPKACPACGERLPDGLYECPGCGLVLAQPLACPECGVDLDKPDLKCWQCGRDLFTSMES